MKMTMTIVEIATGSKILDSSLLLKLAGLPPYKFEGIGVQDDGTPVVFNKLGQFGYLDPSHYRISFGFEQ